MGTAYNSKHLHRILPELQGLQEILTAYEEHNEICAVILRILG